MAKLVVLLAASAIVVPLAGCSPAGGDGDVLSSAKEITSFVSSAVDNSGLSADAPATISGTSISAIVPPSPTQQLCPTITVSRGATVMPPSGVAQDFRLPIAYAVTAEDGTTQDYVAMARVLLTSISFADSALDAIVGATGQTYVDQIGQLAGSNQSIADLSGIEYLTNLTWLNLSYNLVTEVGPLASLTFLTSLELGMGGNNITDVSPLASLTNLWCLNLEFNSIVDVSPLAALTNLASLSLAYNSLKTGVASLVTLTSATQINFIGNTGIPSEDLDTLEAALGPGVVLRP